MLYFYGRKESRLPFLSRRHWIQLLSRCRQYDSSFENCPVTTGSYRTVSFNPVGCLYSDCIPRLQFKGAKNTMDYLGSSQAQAWSLRFALPFESQTVHPRYLFLSVSKNFALGKHVRSKTVGEAVFAYLTERVSLVQAHVSLSVTYSSTSKNPASGVK